MIARAFNRKQAVAFAAGVLMSSFAAGQAQEAKDGEVADDVLAPISFAPAGNLESMVIIGTRTSRRLLDSIDTISRVDESEIEKLQSQSLAEVLRNVPGVEFSSGPRAIAQEPTIRGLGGQRVLITVDGARQNFDSGHKGRVFVETEMLKAVEVQRGAGSAVYGSGALGGVIAMTTKDGSDYLAPGESFGARVKAGYQGASEEQSGTGIVYGRTDLAGGLDFMASGTRRSSDDIRLGGGETLDNSGADSWAGLTKLGWTPGDETRLNLSRQYLFSSGEVPAQADARASATAVLTDRETEVTTDRLSLRHGDGGRRWLNLDTAIYSNRQTIREKRIGTDGRLDIIDFDTRGAELRNTSNFSTGRLGHRLTYGVETFEDKMRSTRGDAASTTFPDADSAFVGAFIQDEVAVNDRLSLVLGLRYDEFESESDRGEEIGVDRETSDSAWSPRAGLLYDLTDSVSLALSYSEAFRAPAFQELYISGVHFGANNFVPNPNLTSETLTQGLEAGIRYSRPGVMFDGDQLALRLTAFTNEYEDFIDSIVTTTITTFDNIGEASTYGSELEVDYRHGPSGFATSLAASYLVGDNETDDQPLSGIPGASLKLTIEKAVDPWGLNLGWRSAFYQRQDRVAPGQPETPGYAVHDIFATWRPGALERFGLSMTLGVDNLFDNGYRTHLSSLPSAGRNVKMTLSGQL
ncbi:MAG: TonB-dependent hemoglobin/transferrin/lactoferrin family receptor [Pseudomonadota bacterium]